MDTGIRRSECCGLKWKDVDFQANTITITGNLCYTPQKGIYLDTPKNGKPRIVDVDPAVMALLRSLRSEQADKAISAYVFTQDGSPEPIHKALHAILRSFQSGMVYRAGITLSG